MAAKCAYLQGRLSGQRWPRHPSGRGMAAKIVPSDGHSGSRSCTHRTRKLSDYGDGNPKPKTNPTPRGESGKRGMSQASEPLHSPDCTLRSAHMAQRVLTRCGPCDTYAEIPSVKGQPETQLTQSCFLWQATPGTTRFNHPSECHASAVAQQSHGSRRRLFSRLNGHSETTRHLQDSTSQNSRRCFPACMSPPVHVMPC